MQCRLTLLCQIHRCQFCFSAMLHINLINKHPRNHVHIDIHLFINIHIYSCTHVQIEYEVRDTRLQEDFPTVSFCLDMLNDPPPSNSSTYNIFTCIVYVPMQVEFRLSPCNGEGNLYVNPLRSPWPSNETSRWNASYPGEEARLSVQIFHADYYISVYAVSDFVFSLSAITRRKYMILVLVAF
jgi:hypothetical protein